MEFCDLKTSDVALERALRKLPAMISFKKTFDGT